MKRTSAIKPATRRRVEIIDRSSRVFSEIERFLSILCVSPSFAQVHYLLHSPSDRGHLGDKTFLSFSSPKPSCWNRRQRSRALARCVSSENRPETGRALQHRCAGW